MNNKKSENDHIFNFNGKSLFLTYKGHLKTSQLKVFKDCKLDVVLEKSTGTYPYNHTHLQIFFNKKKHVRDSRKYDIDGIHPHWKIIKTKEHWKNITAYIRKQNTPFYTTLTGNEWEYLGSLRQVIQEHYTWSNVMNDDSIAKEIQKHFQWAKEVFHCKPRKKLFRHKEFLPWQKLIIKSVNEQQDRTILWCVSEKGNVGKTQLMKHFYDIGAFITRGGSFNDVAYRYEDENIVVMDLVKAQENFTPYKQIETFKDGIIISNKYKGQIKTPRDQDWCKVIVLSNYYPDKSRLIKGRFLIYDIDKDEFIKDEPVVPRSLNINEGSGGGGRFY